MAKNQERGKNMIDKLAIAAAGVVLCRAVYTDIKTGKIENRLIAAGLMGGLLFAAVRDGPKGIWTSVRMMGIVFVMLVFLFIIKGLGAGDIKLFCVLAVFFPEDIIQIIVISFFAGGIAAAGRMLLRFFRGQNLYIRHETMNFSVPIFVGTAFVVGIGWICS